MTDIALWPVSLPQPRADGYGLQPKAAYVSTDMDSGRARNRRRFSQSPSTVAVKWRFTWVEMATFEGFLQYEINLGAAPFSVGLLNGMGINQVKAQFFEDPPYQVSMSDSRAWFDVTANLRVKAMPVASYDTYLVLRTFNEQEILGISNGLHWLVNVKLPGPTGW